MQEELLGLAGNFSNNNLNDYAIAAYQKGRDLSKNDKLYAYEMALAYQRNGDTPNLIKNYLDYASTTPSQVQMVFNNLQRVANNEKDLDEDLYRAFEIDKLLDKKMRTLSGGTTQKVSATLAFLFNPNVLILDEPTAGLDPLASEILKEKISKEKSKGKLILITSHLLSELDDLVSQIIFMQDGKLIFHKNVEQLKKETGTDKISKSILHVLKNEMP